MPFDAPRFSVVTSFTLRSLLNAATIQIGDCLVLAPRSNVIAIARQLPIFSEYEADPLDNPIFRLPIPLPVITEEIRMTRENKNPYIRTGHVSIIGVSTSAIVQIGSNKRIDAEARVKHLRQFLYPPTSTKQKE